MSRAPRWEARLLQWLKVPPEPHPPAGSPGSLRVFRAGRNFLRLRLVVWAGAQFGAVLGVVVSLTFIREIELQQEVTALRAERAAAATAAGTEVEPERLVTEDEVALRRSALHRLVYAVAPRGARDLPRFVTQRALFWIKLGEAVALLGFLGQLVGSLAVVRLDYRQRWYMITDRSLRLRWGIVNVHESTMSFANLQQVALRQGPLQRILGLWNVEVESAGGGSGKEQEEAKDSLHRAVFHGVDEGTEIRDIILARLRHYRDAGLGNPDDASPVDLPAAEPAVGRGDAAVEAASVVLQELRAWRAAIRASTK